MSNNLLARRQQLQKKLETGTALLLSRRSDIAYYTGYHSTDPEREALVLITPKKAVLLHSSFGQPTKESGIEYQIGHWMTKLPELLATDAQTKTVLIDEADLTVAEKNTAAKAKLTLGALDRKLIWQQRMIKDQTEQAIIQQAFQVSQSALDDFLPILDSGITEQEAAWELEKIARDSADELAFPTIVAFGEHAALPHHQPGKTTLTEENCVLIDFGVKINGYCADITRTIWFGDKPPAKFIEIEKIVTEAYQVAEEIALAGTDITHIDAAARQVIVNAGYGKNFIHTTGHGLGLDIHEPPSISATTATVLESGMAITIEPGIYLPEEFGYRYENTVIIS